MSIRLHFCILLLILGLPVTGSTQEDSIRRVLITPEILKSRAPVFPQPPLTPFIIDPGFYIGASDLFITSHLIAPKCGEDRYDNGNLFSRIECENNVPHGKAVYWDNQGRISTVHMYRHGNIYRSKRYSDGKIYLIENFQFTKKKGSVYHGVRIEYENDMKTVEHYNMGKLHGLSTTTRGNMKIGESKCTDGEIDWEKQWSITGQLLNRVIFNRENGLVSHETWNEEGVLLKREYYSYSEPTGEWINYSPREQRKKVSNYENGLIETLDIYIRGNLFSHEEYANEVKTERFTYHTEGRVLSRHKYAADTNDYEYWKWKKNGNRSAHYVIENDHYIGEGYLSLNDSSTLFYKAASTFHEYLPLIRWHTLNGDTTQQVYLPNRHSNPFEALEINSFKPDGSGGTRRHGIWKNYAGNFISSVLTYKSGVLDGRAVYYKMKFGEPIPRKHGYYNNGLKTGVWTETSDTLVETTTYHEDQKNGRYTKSNRIADTVKQRINYASTWKGTEFKEVITEKIDTLIVANYTNNELNGSYSRFDLDGNLIESGSYLNGLEEGDWTTYYPNGEIEYEGAYKNGVRSGKWHHWQLNDKGKMKKTKLIIEGGRYKW